jgi:hypothetical protein
VHALDLDIYNPLSYNGPTNTPMLQLSEDVAQAPFQWRNSQKAPKYSSPLIPAGISSYANSHSSLSTSSFRTIAAHPSQSPCSTACNSTSSPSSFISLSQSSSTTSSYPWQNSTLSSPTSAFQTPISCSLLHGLTTISRQICALSSPRDPPSLDPHHRR